MHKPGTPWPVPTRISYIVAFWELRRQYPRLSARRFCEATESPNPTFARWWAAWRRKGKRGLLDRPKRPRRRPCAADTLATHAAVVLADGRVARLDRGRHRFVRAGVPREHALDGVSYAVLYLLEGAEEWA